MDDAAVKTDLLSCDPAMASRLAGNWWALLIRGLAGIAFAIMAFALPGITLATVVLLFAAYMIVDGAFAIVAGLAAARRHERWLLLLVEGLVDIAAGVLAVLWPGITVLATVLLIAAWSAVTGVLMLIAAFRLDRGRWLMAVAGLVSMVLAVLLVLVPVAGALALIWWIGTYALLFGGMLTWLAIKLRLGQRTAMV